MHPIEQSMARRAEYPDAINGRVGLGAPSPVSSMLGLVRDVQDAPFPARLTGPRCFRMPRIEALQVGIWTALLTRLRVVFSVFLRLLGVELRSGFPRALNRAFRRAMPFVALSSPRWEELRAALAAVAARGQKLARLPIVPKFLLTIKRAELLPGIRGLKSGAALAAMFGALHV